MNPSTIYRLCIVQRPAYLQGGDHLQLTRRLAAALIALAGLSPSLTTAAENPWTAGSGTDLLWSTGANWTSGLAPIGTDDVILPQPIPNPGFLLNPQIITLGSGSVANALSFQDSYTLTGGDLALTSGQIGVLLGYQSTIASKLSGSAGLWKQGGGSLVLTNASNDYAGVTTIANGSLIINHPAALGSDSSAISILTNNETPSNTATTGFNGGSLVLDGTGGGFVFGRDVNFEGRGPIGERGAAILSLGDNTLSGTLTSAVSPLSPATFRNSRINSVNGALTLSGTLSTGGTSATTFTALGGVNTAGVGLFNLTGVLSGTGSVEKSGAGTLFLNPSSTSGFAGTLRISGSGTGQQSTVRVEQLTVGGTSIFGTNTVSGDDPSAIDLNGGVLEFRSDTDLNFNALSSGKNVYHRASSTVFVGQAVGGSGVNGLVTLGTFRVAANTSATFNSRNGYGLTFGGAWTQESSNSGNTITNNLGGTLTFTGNAWNNNDASARTLTLQGAGIGLITGGLNTSGAGTKNLSKQGTGTWEIRGTNTAIDGNVNINNGAVIITDFRSLNDNTATINIGSNASNSGLNSSNNNGAGALIIGTTTTPTAAGLKTSKVINLAGTTNGASIYANQTGVNPVEFDSNFTAGGAGAKTLTLGGTSTANNAINGVVPDNGGTNTTSLLKIGPGTWVLAGQNTFTGATTIANGTLKLQANAAASAVVVDTVGITFNANNTYAGGTLEFVGQSSVNNVETLGALTPTQGANTIRLTPGSGGTASLVFASLGAVGDGATVNIVGSDGSNTVTLTGQSGLNASPRLFFGGADFAYADAGVMRAPVYDTDAGFVNAPGAGALPAGQDSFSINGDITAQGTQTVDTLKFNGGQTLTLSGGATLTVRTGAANTDGAILATGGASTITGGTGLTTAGSGSLTFYVNGASDSLVIDTVIGGGTNTTGGLTKSGAGTLVLTQNNALTGTVSLNEGTIQLSGSGDLGGGNALTMRQGTTLDLNGVTPANNVNAFNNNGSVTSAISATLTVGGSNGTGTSFGTVDGAVSLIKIGTGGQSWLGNSTYTGTTTIGSTGLVTVDVLADGGVASGIGASSSDAANLVFNGSTGGLSYSGSVRNGILSLGSRSASTDRLFTLAGTGARLSSTASNNNAIVWSNTGAIAHALTGPQLITFDGTSAGDNTFNPQLTDSGSGTDITSVTKTGTGQWNLGNTGNSYTGATTVANGILGLNANGALPAGSPLVLGSTTTSGILQMSGTFARNLSATPTAGTGTITWGGTTGGGGFAALATPLTVTLDGGAGVTWGSGGFVPTGAALIFNSGSALSDVTFTNGIDLGAAVRTITVNDNGNTGADYASMTGVLSGAGGGILKNGSGILRVLGANDYTGTTEVQAGTLVVTSLGSSSTAGTSSVGQSGVAMDDSNALVLGNATTTGGILQYVGPGETSDRKIRLRGTTAGNQIHADGAGPLILTNVAHDTTETGNKTLSLRGTNAAGNMITSQLSDNGAGVLTVTVDGGATWILTNGANSYTGNTNVNAGALGIGHDTALGAALSISNGNVFAYGGDRTLTNTLTMVNNTSSGFIGDHSLTFNGTNNLAVSANSITVNNSVAAGEAVTFNGLQANALTGNRAWTIDGPGETVINGGFTTSTAFGVNIVKTGNGTLTLGTDGSTSNWNQAGNSLDLDRGTLKFTASNAIPTTATSTGLTISPESATGDTATVDLNGTTQTVNGLTANSNGILTINNTSASPAAFRFGANDAPVDFGSGTGSYTITDSGAGPLSIVKLGSTNATFISGITLTYQGATRVEGGGLTIASPVDGTSALEVINSGSTLALTGGISAPSAISSVIVENGGTLSLLDGAGNQLTSLTNLQLGSSGGTMTTLNLNVGDLSVAGDNLGTDLFSLLGGGTLSLFSGNQITFNLTDAGLNPNQQYVLLDASAIGGGWLSGGFTISDYLLGGTPGGFTSIDLTTNSTNNQIILTTGNLITGKSWWNAGGAVDAWNDVANWSVDLTPPVPSGGKAGTNPAVSIPGQGTDVIFIADNITGGGAVTTTLEQNFKINSLTFEASSNSANTPASVTIDPGAIATNRLEIAPQASTDGIAITAGGPASVTISAPVKLGADQTWHVADAGSVLTLSGALQGEKDVTKTGAGKITLGAAADPTFNSGVTADLAIDAGTVEITNSGALGTTANSNLVNITVNSTGVFYYNGVAGTVANPITLDGGTLSAGTANQTYSGAVAINSASFINMADSNGPGTNAARNITLSGVVTGTGSLTVSSDSTTLTGGNPESGTLLISNAASTWSGDLTLTSGTVDIGVAASPTVTPGNITFDGFGRVIVRGVNGQTINRAGTMNFTAGTIGEYLVDNTSAPLGADFVVNQNGQVNIGAGGVGASVRFTVNDAASQLNLTGNVVLGGNSSISVDGGDADSFTTISGVISDGGSGYKLTINDDAGGWGASNDIIRLTGLNTFTGIVSLDSGILEFDTVTDISGGASALGNGTAIETTNAATLRFIGSSPQSTNRPITTAGGALTLSANGVTAADTITYNGAITVGPTADGSQLILSGAAGSTGVIAGGIMETSDSADLTVNGGTWTHKTGTTRVGDDMTVTGATTILNLDSGLWQQRDDLTVTSGASLNLNGAGVLSFNVATLSADASLRAVTGGTITINANDAVVTTEFDGLRIGTDGTGIGNLVMNANQTVTEFILGNRNLDREGLVDGTGTLTVAGNLDLYEGTINANLASTGTTALEKIAKETVILRGDNSGLASTGSSIIYEGTLVLDYTASNTTKLRAASALDMRGGNLVMEGNATAATSQSVGSLTLGSGGNSIITLNPAGQDIVLNLNAITRAVNSQDGTMRFNLPSGTQTASNGITTDTLNTIGTASSAILGGWATVNDGTGSYFAMNATNAADGNIVAAVTTLQDSVDLWGVGENISDSSGFTGSVMCASINSLRFNAAAGSDLVIADGAALGIASGGILVTDQAGGTPSLMGGTLVSGAIASNVPELIITQDSSQTFEIGSRIRINQNVVKSGAGALLLSGTNVYTGGTEIQNGTLQLTGGNAVGDTSRVTLSDRRNSTLQLLANETIGRLQGGQRNTDTDFGVVDIGSFTLTINETGGNTTYAGKFSGSGNVVKTGSSTLSLSGNDSIGSFSGGFAVDQGLVVLNSTGTPLQGVDSITLTGSASSLRLDNDQTTAVGSRIRDAATIILNSTAGNTADALGLYMRRTSGTTQGTETVGQLILNSGHNTVAADGTAASRIGQILFSDATPLVRNNFSTLFVVARNMNATTGQRGRISFSADPGGSIGGGGAAASSTINIFPYMVGENTAGGPSGATNFGNTFVRYDAGTTDLRALDLTTEYAVDEAAYNALGSGVLTNNVRFTTSPGAALDSDTTGINSLILDSAAGLSLSGPAQALQITSGAILSAAAGANAIGGFTEITTATGNPYYFYVTNPSGSLTLATTALSSAETLVKSGAGTLILGAANSVTDVYLNQGVLEIADLDNIGGNSGALVFAGGTLRLGATLTDDISSRTISFLLGGGTIDTNGIDLSLANSLGSGAGGFSKAGDGTLTLNASASFTGPVVLSAGTVTIGAGNALGVGGDLSIGAGAVLDVGTSSISHGLVTLSGLNPVINGTGTISASTGFFFNNTDTAGTTVDAVLAGAGGLLKAQTNTLTLTGTNTYTGITEVQNGTLSLNNLANVGAGASALGAPATVEDGMIRMGLSTAATTLNYTGVGSSSDRLIAMQGTTGSVTLDADGTGALALGGVHVMTPGNKSLILRGSSDPSLVNMIGAIEECNLGVLTLNKADANTWQLTAQNHYSGVTQVDNGILQLGLTDALPVATTVRIGTGTTAGTLDLNGFDQTIGSLLVQTTTNAVVNKLIVDPGNTLTVTGAVTIGVNSSTTATTAFEATGGGALVVNSGGANFQVGGATGTTNSNSVTADLSGLSSFTADLGGGSLRLGDANSGTTADPSTLKLATNNTITAASIRIGDGSGPTSVHTLTLGSGTNVFNMDALNIGSAGNTIRSSGALIFDAGDTTGTLTVRAADGTSPATINMVNTTGSTAGNIDAVLNTSGHTVDILASTLTMAARTQNTGAASATLTFDQGTLDVTTLNMASRTGAGTGGAAATVNLGGGTTTIDSLNMAVNTSGGGTVTADFNVTAGTVTLGTGTGTAVNMANAATGLTVTSTMNLTGGTVAVTGDILRTGGAGTENATVVLNGSALDMSGNSIGSPSAPVALAAESGTLSNLFELNGGTAPLDKTTAGTLTLGNGNTYTGGTTVTAGTLLANNTAGSATGSGPVTTSASTVLGGNGTITVNTGDITLNGALDVGNAGDLVGQTLTLNTNATSGTITANDYVVFDIFSGQGTGALNANPDANDLLIPTGNTFLIGAGANLKVTTSLPIDGTWQVGSAWKLIDWFGITSVSGTFANLAAAPPANYVDLPDLSSIGLAWDVSNLYTQGTIVVVVPEPGRVTLLMLGLLGLCLRRRRRQ